MSTRHGRFAVAILVMQDVAAVVLLVLAKGRRPSPWALLPPLLLHPAVVRQDIDAERSRRTVRAIGLAVRTATHGLFYRVNIAGVLGALLFGVPLSQHEKARELSRFLLSLKDIFLVGLFPTIGLLRHRLIGRERQSET